MCRLTSMAGPPNGLSLGTETARRTRATSSALDPMLDRRSLFRSQILVFDLSAGWLVIA
jgi:hypothetical protein